MSPEELQNIADGVIAQAAENEQIEVACSHGLSSSVRAYQGAVESMTQAESMGLGVRVLVDGREGFASAGSLEPDVVADALTQARGNAAFAEADPHVGVAEPDGVEPVAIDLWRDGVAETSVQEKVDLALSVEDRVRSADDRITGVRVASYGDRVGAFALASTAGISIGTRASSAGVSVQSLAEDGERTQTGYGYDSARQPQDLNLGKVVDRAVERTVGLLGASKPASSKVDLVLEPEVVSTVIGLIASTLTGDRVLKGRSPFVGRVGEQVASPLLSFEDDPTDPDSLAADSHDGEGLACRRVNLVTDGVLNGFLHDSYTGRRSGEGSTGSAVRGIRGLPSPGVQALVVKPGEGSLDELVAGVDLGLFVYGLAGLHSGVNPVSGDFSVGVEGRMIRDGELAEPVSECTIGSTLQRLMLDVSAVGGDFTRLASGVSAPSMVIGGVSLAGSEA